MVGTKLWPKKTQPPGELNAEGRAEMEATSGPLTYSQEVEGRYRSTKPGTELPTEPEVFSRGHTIEQNPVVGRREIG
jgi:hypothetical protein